MKYFRINNKNKIVEVFPYDVFHWIPNSEFLANCYALDTEAEIKQGYYYINEEIVTDYTEPQEEPEPPEEEPEPTESEIMQDYLLDLDMRIIELELMNGGDINGL